MADAARLVLASASAARAKMLSDAGLAFETDPARIDEAAVKDSLKAEKAGGGQLADTLAELKATAVARRHPGALVLGADQVLEFKNRLFDKPADRTAAWTQLTALRGESHRLISAAVVVRDGERIWGQTDFASLLMRPFSDAFLEQYLDRMGDAVTQTVGGYQLEGLGAQLFQRVDGDFFTILGLPLLPLLEFLRGHRILVA